MLENSKIDIREYWQIFLRRKFFFVIPLVLSVIVGIVLCFTTTPVYESSTVIRINEGQMLSQAMRRLVPGVTARERLIGLRRLITSHAYLKRLIETLNLYNDQKVRSIAEEKVSEYPDLTVNEIIELIMIERLKKVLTIQQQGSEYVKIIAVGSTPTVAFNLVYTLAQIFIDESLRSEVGGIRGALEFSTEQLELYKSKLEQSEEKLRKFKQGIVDEEFNNQSLAQANLEQVNSQLTTTSIELREANDRLNFLIKKTANLDNSNHSPNTNKIRTLKAQLLEAVLELSKLMLKFNWQNTNILKINSEIEILRESLKQEIENEIKYRSPYGDGDQGLDLIVEKEIKRMDIDFLKRKQSMLENTLDIYRQSVSKGPRREMTLDRLTREVAANREIYQSFLQQTRGSEIEEALQRSAAEHKFKIIEPAMKPLKPIHPNRVKIMLMAIALGAGIGIGIIALLEYMNNSFRNVEDVEKYLNLPVLGTMPKINYDIDNPFKNRIGV